MDLRTRAACHEAGHTVVGLHFGFQIHKIDVTAGRPNVKCELDSPQRSAGERYIYLAGGIAGEKFFEPGSDYDRLASGRDQIMITDRQGGSIEEYLPVALEVLRLKQKAWRAFRERLKKELLFFGIKAGVAAGVGVSPHREARLLSGEEIMKIWAESDAAKK